MRSGGDGLDWDGRWQLERCFAFELLKHCHCHSKTSDVKAPKRVSFSECNPQKLFKAGEMAEWLKAHAWKACLGETLTWVRIPLSPPYFLPKV